MKPFQRRMARAALTWSTPQLAHAAGVEFIPENGGGAGVRLRKRAE